MRLENTEHYISKESCGECILISKAALEKWRDHYLKESNEIPEAHPAREFMMGHYTGKASVLCDLLKHFEEEDGE